jgi:hypothetical protein
MTITDAQELLSFATPQALEIPARIEQLNLGAHSLLLHISDLKDEAGQHEEDATAASADESNADKRKAKRAELLRDDAEYFALKAQIRDAESMHTRVTERAARLRREFQLHVAQAAQSVF